ncbi:hypothetical protein B0H65DRAFT_408854, partial [Neurospora tetraspora]
QHRQATGVVPGPLMAVFPGAHMQGMYAVPVMIPAQPLTQATLNYTWANPYTRGMEPQPTEMLQPLWHYPGNTMYQPHLLLDQLQPSCPVDNGGSGSKLVHSDGHVQVKVPGHLMAKNMSQNAERNNQDIPSDLEPFPACGRDFAKTLSKVMTKTSDRLMALLEAELDRLDKLDAASEASGAVQDVNIKPGIKSEGNSGQNDELDSPGTESDKADEEPPILNEVGSRPQTSDEPKKFHRVTMTDEQQERNTVAGRPLSSN